jgi:hypothetical protein
MTKCVMVVYSSAKPGREAEYLDWYQNVHIADMCSIPGVNSGRFFEASPASPAKPAATYLAIYELDVDDPAVVLQGMAQLGQSGRLQATDAIDLTSVQISFFKQKF